MSRKSNQFRIRGQLRTALDRREEEPTRFRAIQGDGAGTVKVPGKPRYIYVRRLGRSRFEECLNVRTPTRYDLPVVVGYLHELPDILQVLDVGWTRITGPGDYAYVPAHHESHEFRNDDGGDDVVWIQKQAVIPLLCHPTSPTSMRVVVLEDNYPWLAGWNLFPGATSEDLTARIPGVGESRFVLIYVDGATNLLGYSNGTPFPTGWIPAIAFDFVPAPPSGSVPVAAVLLSNGMTAIDWPEIYDLRLFNQPIGGSITPGPHSLLDPAVHDDTSLDSPTRGSLIYGNPPTGTFSQWDELPIGVTGTFLGSTGVEPVWTTAPPPGPHAILSAVHSDAAVQAVSRGSLIVGNAVWDELPIGATGTYLRSTGLDPVWSPLSTHNELVGLQGGQAGEYYHFTQAQHTSFTVVAEVGSALVCTGVNVWGADLTPLWMGTHTWGSGFAVMPTDATGQDLGDATHRWDLHTQSVLFEGAAGNNSITIPDELVDAFHIIDTGGTEFLRLNTDDNYLLIDPAAAGIHLGVGTAAPDTGYKVHVKTDALRLLYLEASALSFAVSYTSVITNAVKTAGASDHADAFFGPLSMTELDQVGGTIGTFYGGLTYAILTEGEVGDVSNAKYMIGKLNQTTLTDGKVWGSAIGGYSAVVQGVANEVTADIYGHYIFVDSDGTVGNHVITLYLIAGSNVDYGIYQAQAIKNYFAGRVGIGVTPLYHLDILDADTTAYIRVKSTNGDAGLMMSCKSVTGDARLYWQEGTANRWGLHYYSPNDYLRLYSYLAGRAIVDFKDDGTVVFAAATHVGLGAAPGARLDVDGGAADDPLTILDSLSDNDAAFINFRGVVDTDASKSIGEPTFPNAATGLIKIQINGVDRWLMYYAST